MNRRQKALFVRAFFTLGKVCLELRHKPLKELLPNASSLQADEKAISISPGQSELIDDIGKVVRSAAAYTPWNSACLVQVLAAQKLLQSERLPGTVFIGASRDGLESGIDAHAWLTSAGRFVTGEQGHEKYTVISRHSWS